MNPTKICRICGDKALGFNFNGLSCESCRLFFIRNAHRHESLHCSTKLAGNECEITVECRNCCQRCRMDKCVKIGMKKELIKGKYAVKKVNSLTKIALVNESSIFYSRPLQFNEIALMYELQGAISFFCEEASLEIVGPSSSLGQAYQFSVQHIRPVVKFCKNICAFKALQECDQLVLLREFLCHIQLIRSAFMFDRQKDGYPMLLTAADEVPKAIFIKIHIFGQWKSKNVEHFYRNVLHSLQMEMENDAVIRNLFIAHALFKPLEGVTCPELIRYHYHVYRHLLKRYYEHKYGHTRAADKFSSLMQMLSAMSQVKVLCKEIYDDINNVCKNDQTSQLLKEIFFH